MSEKKTKEPLNEYFLIAILSEPEMPEETDGSLTKKLGVMSGLAVPEIKMGEDFSISYQVSLDEIKNKIMDEEEAYKIRTLGWKLDDDKKQLVLTL